MFIFDLKESALNYFNLGDKVGDDVCRLLVHVFIETLINSSEMR